MSDILTTIGMTLVSSKIALEKAQEIEVDRRERVAKVLETLKIAAEEALLLRDGELDPGTVLVLAEKLNKFDREYSEAVNTRTARDREVNLLEAWLEETKK